MGKNTLYKAPTGLAEQLLLAMNPNDVVSASFDFLVAGTPRDNRKDILVGVEGNEPK